MIAPRKVKFAAKKKANENFRFRQFLKIHADAETLDQQFLELHRELFAEYDCARCRNCCKMYYGSIPEEDLERDAQFLQMSREEFVNRYLNGISKEGEYSTLHRHCDFLQKDGSCLLGENRPESCRNYPHTDQPDRLGSLYSILDFAEVCPVVYEMLERLKKIYDFH